MCAYNPEQQHLFEAVNSIINQTFKDFELIIINDGSDSFPSLDWLTDSRVTVIKNEINKGISFSRNFGLSIAKGKYIAIMDSDDIAEPRRLQKEFDFLENNPLYVACGTWFKQFGEKRSECKRNIDDSSLYKARLLFGNEPTLLDPSCMIRKSVLIDNEITYDESMKSGMDYMMWVILSEHGEIHNVKEILMNYRTHPNQITKKGYKHYDWNVKNYQLLKLGIHASENEKVMLMESLQSKSYSLNEYRQFLDKIIDQNDNFHYYEKEALEKVVNYQWYKKLLYSKNIFYLIKGFFAVKKQKRIFLKAVLRHFGLFKKMDEIIDGAK